MSERAYADHIFILSLLDLKANKMTSPKYYFNKISEYEIQICMIFSLNSYQHLCKYISNIKLTFHVNKIAVKKGRKTEGDIL